MEYLHWKEEKITDFSDANISAMYDRGFVFTRIGKGVMHQTRSVRVDLSKFELSSENRRILKKVEGLQPEGQALPLKDYHWSLGKLAKDFYDTKFGDGIFSAQKVKEILTSKESNFNSLLTFGELGYAICYINKDILHYSYPFYDLTKTEKDMGLWMMTTAIRLAQETGLKYVYLGSLQRPGDTYKLQFAGLEWFDGERWNGDIERIKIILKQHE
jgi:arginyl-tRNA--protein-N-Asp/Glu arginylyltransferase